MLNTGYITMISPVTSRLNDTKLSRIDGISHFRGALGHLHFMTLSVRLGKDANHLYRDSLDVNQQDKYRAHGAAGNFTLGSAFANFACMKRLMHSETSYHTLFGRFHDSFGASFTVRGCYRGIIHNPELMFNRRFFMSSLLSYSNLSLPSG